MAFTPFRMYFGLTVIFSIAPLTSRVNFTTHPLRANVLHGISLVPLCDFRLTDSFVITNEVKYLCTAQNALNSWQYLHMSHRLQFPTAKSRLISSTPSLPPFPSLCSHIFPTTFRLYTGCCSETESSCITQAGLTLKIFLPQPPMFYCDHR